MSPRPNPPAECVRAWEWVSLRLDSRLSEFEAVLLDAHLAQCPDCRAFAGTVAWATEALRSAPLEQPQLAFELPRRRRAGALRAGMMAAVAGIAAVAAVVGLQLSTGGTPTASAHVSRAVIGLKERQMDQLDASGRLRGRTISPGVAAARQETLGRSVGATRPDSPPRRVYPLPTGGGRLKVRAGCARRAPVPRGSNSATSA